MSDSRGSEVRYRASTGFSGAFRTFAYFMTSGSQRTIGDLDYTQLYGREPQVIAQVFAIYVNVVRLDANGEVVNEYYAEKRATDFLRAHMDPSFIVDPPYEEWELDCHHGPSA